MRSVDFFFFFIAKKYCARFRVYTDSFARHQTGTVGQTMDAAARRVLRFMRGLSLRRR
jgi:hypothetical protein